MAVSTHQPPGPDYTAIKSRQQQTWGSGDYQMLAALIVPISERLCDAVDLRSGERMLDVATGTGNTAIAAARRLCTVTGMDYVPALLERGRARAAVEGLSMHGSRALPSRCSPRLRTDCRHRCPLPRPVSHRSGRDTSMATRKCSPRRQDGAESRGPAR